MKTIMRVQRIALCTALALAGLGAPAAWAQSGGHGHLMATPDELKWADVPSLPAGAKVAVIEGPLNENQQADVAAIYQSAQNLLHLISTVVDLSKLEANRLKIDLKPVNLNEVLEAVLAGSIMEQPNFSTHLPAVLPFVLGDCDRLEQMLKSLLKFAFKLTKKGAITLTAQSSGANEVTLGLDIEQAQLGQGETAELFELIVKVDPTGRTTLGRGGLDLPLVRFLAEQQQGRVWAESQSNGHLVIYLSLTVSAPPP